MEHLSFKICGSFLTDHIRERFASGDVGGAIATFNCLIPEDPNFPGSDSLLKDIIVGNKGFKGVSPNIELDENVKNENITKLTIRAAYNSDEEAVGVVTKILEIEDPIEYLVQHEFHSSEPEKFQGGWITKFGHCLDAGFSKHDQLCHDINRHFNLDLYNPVHYFEKRWVRISYAYQGEWQVFQAYGGLTKKQKEVLLKFVKNNNLSRNIIWINGYGYIKDGKFYKK